MHTHTVSIISISNTYLCNKHDTGNIVMLYTPDVLVIVEKKSTENVDS